MYITSERYTQAKDTPNCDITTKIIIIQPQCIKLIKTTQNPLLQKSLLQSGKCVHYVQSHCNCHSAAHVFPPSASDHYSPLFLALLAVQRPSRPIAPGPLV